MYQMKGKSTVKYQKTTLQTLMCSALLIISMQIPATMNIIEWNMYTSPSYRVPTEYMAYKLLKENPLTASVNYLAVPWDIILNNHRLSSVPKFKLDGGFTICQNIKFEQIIPLLKEMGIDTLFTPHVKHNKRYDNITVLPFPHYSVNSANPADKKDIWYSFIGAETNRIRKEIFKLPKSPEVYIKRRATWHFWQPLEKQILEKEEYKNVLARSRFSLCPCGTGAGTIRFWESLQAGAIPVIISNTTCLPEGVDWSSCTIRIEGREIKNINKILGTIDCDTETIMRKNALLAYEAFSGSNFISPILRHYQDQSEE